MVFTAGKQSVRVTLEHGNMSETHSRHRRQQHDRRPARQESPFQAELQASCTWGPLTQIQSHTAAPAGEGRMSCVDANVGR